MGLEVYGVAVKEWNLTEVTISRKPHNLLDIHIAVIEFLNSNPVQGTGRQTQAPVCGRPSAECLSACLIALGYLIRLETQVPSP